ncbi:MAG: gliding motility-associated ABC transporter ATP-binding subunit GldA [Bacteroidetes bacterium]|nr:gliding motility-associated ABC transporter ATP-binding subunit GldA [Bacteroidota bacterium]MBP9790626.1 gliding motility-associated ABC transporter ATP-binding subunit GldA [Bacteroidia bacterium]
MISVKNITKVYGTQKAVDDVSFEIGSGQVIGFLGPNGAGKSTMMKIITCYIPQTSGDVSVCGYDVTEQSIDVKKIVGYLPEHNPLYPEMYVKEYLNYICGVYKFEGKKDAKIKELIELTGLTVEQNKKIAALSKGYRQRVGLAQALIHDPKVLILDEPTSGLDPNQLTEIRALIKSIGKEKTVVLSTHIMQEVEAICDRVIIINRGKIVANESTSVLQKSRTSGEIILVEFDSAVSEKQLRSIDGVQSCENINGNKWRLKVNDLTVRSSIFKWAVANDLTALSLQVEEQRLEDVFHQLTNNE